MDLSEIKKYFLEKNENIQKIKEKLEFIFEYQGEISSKLQEIHNSTEEELYLIVENILKEEPKTKELYQNLWIEVPFYYKYSGIIKKSIEDTTFQYGLIEFIKKGEIIKIEKIKEIINFNYDLNLIIESYLIGLTKISNELSRFCINSVTNGLLEMPEKIYYFIQKLNSGFKQLTFKNSDLRRRFDSIKYDIKTIESVRYDLFKFKELTKLTNSQQF